MNHKIEDSLYTLYHINNQIALLYKAILSIDSNLENYNPILSEFDEKRTLEKVAIPGLLHNIYILSCSYLDEWNKHLTQYKYSEYASKIEHLKKVTKPALKKINKWSGLKSLRNVVFAHNLRDKKGKSIFTTDKKLKFVFPMSYSEASLLVQLINIITEELYNSFSDITIDINKSILDSLEICINQIDTNKELQLIIDEINNLKK
jgi:hypothetical protein